MISIADKVKAENRGMAGDLYNQFEHFFLYSLKWIFAAE